MLPFLVHLCFVFISCCLLLAEFFTVILISFDCSFCCYSFRQAFSPSKSPLYLLGNILSASGFAVPWMMFVRDREGARPRARVSACDMHALLIVWQLIIWVFWGICQGGVEMLLYSWRGCFLSGLCWSQGCSRKQGDPDLREPCCGRCCWSVGEAAELHVAP